MDNTHPFGKLRTLPHTTGEDWHRARAQGVGGSECAAILGQCKYRGPLQVWRQKTGRVERFNGNHFTRVGSLLERPILDLFPELNNGDALGTILHQEYDCLRGHVDAYTDSGIIVDIKTSERKKDTVEPGHYWQLQFYMALTGADFGRILLCVLDDDRETIDLALRHGVDHDSYAREIVDKRCQFYWYDVPRDDVHCETLVERCVDFWSYVENDIPPTPGAADMSIVHTTKEVYDRSPDEELDRLGFEYHVARTQVRRAKDRLKSVKSRLTAALGPDTSYQGDRVGVSWVSFEKESFDSESLKRDHPDLYRDYVGKIQIKYVKSHLKKQ